MKNLIVLFAVLMITSCVYLGAKQESWQDIGYQDGVAGHVQRDYVRLSAIGSTQQSDYERGYLLGLDEYCNPNFAYQIGLSGQYYEGVCSGREHAQKFRMEWQRGWNAFNR